MPSRNSTTQSAPERASPDNKTVRTVLPIHPLNTIKYTKQILGCGATSIYTHLANKKLRAKKMGKLTMIVGESIVELIAEMPDFEPKSQP
jgi:hypothetical protein